MPMRITCPNCGKQFSAWDDLVGKPVECPKCHQKTVIAGPNTVLEPPPAGSGSNRSTVPSKPIPVDNPKPPPKKSGPVPSTKPAGGTPRAPAPPPPPNAQQPLKSLPTATPRPVSPRPAPAGAFDDDDSLPNGCPNCNATMAPNDDLCDACGYHLILKKVIDISEMPRRNQATGFERVFQSQLQDPESTSNTLLWIKIVASLILVAVLILCLGRWWWIGVLLAAGIGAFWWMKQRRHGESSAGSNVNQDPISVVIWSVFLTMQRVIGWRKLQWPFSKARSLILCDPAFNDKELAGLERLTEIEALDLEGTGLTDGAVEHLRTLKQLKFLVLRRTQVTPAAVQRLQQDLRDTMIWS